MKKKAVVLGLAGAMLLGTCSVSAANGTQNISATFRNIKIVVDGKQVSTSAEPFIYNGTTYLPIRAVGEAVGKEVTWDSATNTVYLGAVPASAQQPATPAPASDTAILRQYRNEVGLSEENFSYYFPAIRSGEESAFFVTEVYSVLIDYIIYSSGDRKLVEAAYAEAQGVFASATKNPDYAEAKADFEEKYQMFLRNL